MELQLYNKFITNTKTLKNKILLESFYNNRNDSYAKEKIKLFRENITQYWCRLSKLCVNFEALQKINICLFSWEFNEQR